MARVGRPILAAIHISGKARTTGFDRNRFTKCGLITQSCHTITLAGRDLYSAE